MKDVLKLPHLYTERTGWRKTGPLFSPFMALLLPRVQRLATQSWGQVTPQGFLFYFFTRRMRNGPLRMLSGLRTGQLEVCTINWRDQDIVALNTGTTDFACPNAIERARSSGKVEIPVYHSHKLSGHVKYFPLEKFTSVWPLLS